MSKQDILVQLSSMHHNVEYFMDALKTYHDAVKNDEVSDYARDEMAHRLKRINDIYNKVTD